MTIRSYLRALDPGSEVLLLVVLIFDHPVTFVAKVEASERSKGEGILSKKFANKVL